MIYDLPHGIVRVCAGLVEAEDVLPDFYKKAIKQAEICIGESIALDAEKPRAALVSAVKLSLANQKDWPYEFLEAHYHLAMSRRTFYKEKRRFCWSIANILKLV